MTMANKPMPRANSNNKQNIQQPNMGSNDMEVDKEESRWTWVNSKCSNSATQPSHGKTIDNITEDGTPSWGQHAKKKHCNKGPDTSKLMEVDKAEVEIKQSSNSYWHLELDTEEKDIYG